MRRRREEESEHEDRERWLVSYADFITLMFAFFVVLYATSEKNLGRAEEFQESINKYLIKVAGGVGVGGAPQTAYQAQELDTAIEPPLPTYPRASPAARQAQRQMEIFIESELSREDIEAGILDIALDDYGVRLSLSSLYLFERESAQFNPEALGLLNRMASMLRRLDRKMIVESHTGSEPLKTSRYPSHWELSSARATSLIRYLARVHQFEESDLIAVSYGSQRPLKPGSGPESERLNNRLDLLILTDDSPL